MFIDYPLSGLLYTELLQYDYGERRIGATPKNDTT